MRRIWVLFVVFVVFALLGYEFARAQQENAPASTPTHQAPQEPPRFAIVPVGDFPDGYFKDLEISPGGSLDLAVSIMNVGMVPVELSSFKVNALSGPNGGYIAAEENDPPIGATEWVEYPSISFSLSPGEEKRVDFTVSVPSNAAPGQYITSLMVRTPESLAIRGTETLRQVIGSALTLSVVVPGELVYDFDLGVPELLGNSLVVPVTNTGNYLVRPSGELVLKDGEGKTVHSSPVNMGSVYTGLATTVEVALPDQTPPGEYTLYMSLTDPDSGAMDSINGAVVTVPEPVDPTGVSVINAAVEPNADPIAFANVDLTVNNGGQQIPATNVTLEVMRDGELVEEYPLATNQVLLSGENQFTDRYIPAEMWESGTYTFNIVVSAVDPNGGQETILLDEELDATIVVP